jgi:hypothetical protein
LPEYPEYEELPTEERLDDEDPDELFDEDLYVP